jgi:hypothetical protein
MLLEAVAIVRLGLGTRSPSARSGTLRVTATLLVWIVPFRARKPGEDVVPQALAVGCRLGDHKYNGMVLAMKLAEQLQ